MKAIGKLLMYAIAFICVAPWAGVEKFLRAIFKRDVLFAGQAELLSLVPGKTGSYFRNVYYYLTLEHCPLHCRFLLGSMFTHSQARVGERVYVGAHCLLGMVEIGDDTMLADHVYVLSGSAQHGIDDPTLPFQQQAGTFTRIAIGKNVWIGTNTVVMADVGEDCIIGAASNVTKSVPDGHVAAGNPARTIRKTFPESQESKSRPTPA
jgi:virginiamycin A acetyltransferase